MSECIIIPSTHKALVVQPNKTVVVEELPVPTIADNQVLVQVVAVAQNPTDWKHADFISEAIGNVLGCDFAGKVVKIGKDVTTLAIGDRVSAFVNGGHSRDCGAFAQYVKADEDLVWKIPEGTTFEEAAALNCACWTVGQGFYHPQRLDIVDLPAKAEGEPWILINGGSTSVGLYAIQFAKLSGLKSMVLVSDKNADLCKSLGATVTYPYRDKFAAIHKVKEVTGGKLHLAIDTISSSDSQDLCMKTFGRGPGRLLVLLEPSVEAAALRTDVGIKHTFLYTALGVPFKKLGMDFPPFPEDRAQIAGFLEKLPSLVASKQIVPNPIKLWDGGLESIKDGLKYMQEGKNSAEKIVYRL